MSKNKNDSKFSVAIANCSIKNRGIDDLTPREKVMYKDTQNAIAINEYAIESKEAGVKAIIKDVIGFIELDVHNENVTDVDYKNYVIITEEGEKYVTGSEPFWNSFMNIYEDMCEESEKWDIEVNMLPSKNYKGKSILTCSLV